MTVNLNKALNTNMRIIQRSVQDCQIRVTCETILDTLPWLDPPTFTTFTHSTHNLNKLLWTTLIAITHIHSKTSFTSNHKVQKLRFYSKCIKIVAHQILSQCHNFKESLESKLLGSIKLTTSSSIALGICVMSTLPNSIS